MEKPFVIRWNIIGFAGGGAFLLSSLLGIFSGNPFLTILLRAFIFGVVFALLGGGAAFVLERFIPQIAGGEGAPEREATGKNIDIMLSGEPLDGERDVEELAMEDDGRPELSPVSRDAPSAEEAADTLHEEPETASSSPSAYNDADDDGRSASLLDEKDVEGEMEPEEPDLVDPPARRATNVPPSDAPEKTAESGGGESDLDVLPDMSHFESSFAPVTSAGMVNDTDTYDGFGSDSLKEKGVKEDPATIVKAVRTIIRRDEGKRK